MSTDLATLDEHIARLEAHRRRAAVLRAGK
jgi:hypothetical protein